MPEGVPESEEVASALARLQELGFTNVNSVEELMKAANDKLGTEEYNGEIVSKLLVQMLQVTDKLQAITGPAATDTPAQVSNDATPERFMEKLEMNTRALEALV
eukprot:TRINITY_DN12856_c0_g1_i1.p1 TRINITY_DN12856_c0_g1~~TRINITY_DN12856_c0_g1_i1.p1  ORF type:complete len:104 (+),score=29.16 TRINITY_DN12856_c0_g1_i1:52-363(+)